MRPRVFRALVGSLVEALAARNGAAVESVLGPLDAASQRAVYDAAMAEHAARAAMSARAADEAERRASEASQRASGAAVIVRIQHHPAPGPAPEPAPGPAPGPAPEPAPVEDLDA